MSTLKDLNTHLFAQLDRLANADKSELDAEVKDKAKLERELRK